MLDSGFALRRDSAQPDDFSGHQSHRSIIDGSSRLLNPRQRETWGLQSTHQSRLNYLHFKSRLNGKELNLHDVEEDRILWPESADEVATDELEERELVRILEQEKRILDETRRNTKAEIDRCEEMLSEFRRQRQLILQNKREEVISKRKSYEQELRQLKESILNEEAEINIHIRNVEYYPGDELSGLNSSAALEAHPVGPRQRSSK
jgi:hypothetical protein